MQAINIAEQLPVLQYFPVFYSVPSWTPELNLTVNVVVQLVLVFALAFYSMYLASGFLSKRFVKGYKSLGRETQIEWDTRVVSTIHAFISAGLALYLLFGPQHDKFLSSPVNYFSELSIVTISLTNGYLLQDVLIVLANIKTISSPYSTIIHHFVGLTSMNFGAASTFVHYFCLMFISTEASTPLVNSRWFLHVLGKKDSKIYVINGICMILSFFFARITMIPRTTMLTYQQMNTIIDIPVPVFISCLLPIALLAGHCLNLYWFWLMVRGLLRILFPKDKKRSTTTTTPHKTKKQ